MENRIEEELSKFMPKVMREFAKKRSNLLTRGTITIPQMILLEILEEKKTCTMSDLARDIGVTTSAVTGITDRLIHLKLIKRIRGVKDRRIVFITLTKNGEAMIMKLLNQRKQMMQKALSCLTDNERKLYLKLMQKIHGALAKK